MSDLVPPHGGKLVPLLVDANEMEEWLREAKSLKRIKLNSKEVSDLIMLGTGAFSPLQGFMAKEDYRRVVSEMRLTDDLLWPIPITLSAWKEEADKIREGERIALANSDNDEILGSMLVEENFDMIKGGKPFKSLVPMMSSTPELRRYMSKVRFTWEDW